MKRKTICILLLLAMLTSTLASCGTATEETTETEPAATVETTPAETESEILTRANTPDNLPDNLDFGGAIVRIHGRGDTNAAEELAREQTGDVVDDAIYNRNMSVEERLNVTIEAFTPFGWQNYSQAVTQIRASVQAGDDEYQIIAGYSAPIPALVADKILNNLHQVPYVEVGQPWWAQSIVNDLTVKGHLDFLCGDIALTMLEHSYTMAINFSIAENYGITDIYETVLSGEWTIDKLRELSAMVYEDTNGDGIKNSEDICGLLIGSELANDADAFMQGSLITLTSRDANDLPVLDADLEKLAALTEKVYSLFYENEGAVVDKNIAAYELFPEDKALFSPSYLSFYHEEYREMESDYGILPYPKFDEKQEKYSTRVQDGVSIWAIPITVQNLECVGATLEAMAAESYRTVTPAYFETALKSKYSRDEQSLEMLDIIRDGVMFNFEIIYNGQMGSPWNIMRELMSGKKKDFASAWASKEKNYKSSLEKLLKNFE